MTWAEPEVIAEESASEQEVAAGRQEVVRELEEECEQLNAELQRVVVENKHLKESIRTLETRDVSTSHEDDVTLREERIAELENEVRQLQLQLVERDDTPAPAADNSWLDSDAEADDSESRAVTSRASLEKQVAVLRSQLLEVTQQNEQLQKDNNNSCKQLNGNIESDDVTPHKNDELVEYKRQVSEEISKLQQFLETKKVSVVNGHASPEAGTYMYSAFCFLVLLRCKCKIDKIISENFDSPTFVSLQKDIEVICQQVACPVQEKEGAKTRRTEADDRKST